jgi:predicted CoA-binding protein
VRGIKVDTQQQIEEFLRGSPHAVVGASRDRSKYGNKVLRAYLQTGREVFPVNPFAAQVEGRTAYPDLAALPAKVHGVSVITPPEQTEAIVAQAGELGIKHIWLQPGSETPAAIALGEQLAMNLIAEGPCVLVALHFRE